MNFKNVESPYPCQLEESFGFQKLVAWKVVEVELWFQVVNAYLVILGFCKQIASTFEPVLFLM